MHVRTRFGEYSGKDLEAVISRAVMVKPLASMFTSYPPIYEPNSTCLEVCFLNSEIVRDHVSYPPIAVQCPGSDSLRLGWLSGDKTSTMLHF